jgi:RND family efflux transporter MFP subunit
VFRIAQDGPRDVVFSVPEDKVGLVRLGSGASVQPWSSAESLPATVREVASSADPVTRTFAVKLAVDAKHSLPLGTTVTVRAKSFDHSGTQAIRIPTSALRREADYTAVWVLDTAAMVVNLQRVEIATADGNMAVVGAGLQPGMQIVVAGVHVLAPGQKVTVYQDQNAAAAPAAQVGK